MSTRTLMTGHGTSPLLWPLLLLLLPLTPEANLTRQPSQLSFSTSMQNEWRNPEAIEDWEEMAGVHQGSEREDQVNFSEDINEICGKPKGIGKVIGGQKAVSGQWPWQASLLFGERHLCGAVLLDARWLVSAAHCFLNKSQNPENYKVLLGNTQLYQQTQHTQKVPVKQIFTHQAFEKFHPFGSDIALVQLRRPVNFTSYVIPVCLPSTNIHLSHQTSCWITGWGKLSEDMKLSPPFLLQEGKANLLLEVHQLYLCLPAGCCYMLVLNQKHPE
ncbi:putative serine protease 47 isoform 2-T7 [Thomomys bottae]